MTGWSADNRADAQQAPGPVTVLIADDEVSIRSGLEKIIGMDGDLLLVAAATNATEAISLAAQHQPAVALLDVNMPGGGGPRAAAGIRASSPRTRVIGHSVHDDRAAVMEMVRAGAVGYLVKGTPGETIRETLHRAGRGQSSLSGEVVSTIVYELASILQLQDQAAEGRRIQVADARRLIKGEGLTFQADPVFDLRTGEQAGEEARALIGDGAGPDIDAALQSADAVGYRVEAERALISLALRDLAPPPAGGFLALPASPAALTSAGFSDLVLGSRHPLMLQISGTFAAPDYAQLKTAVGFLRYRGVRVAVTGLGRSQHALAHTLAIRPDVVKLDAILATSLAGDPLEAMILTTAQALVHALGADLWVDGLGSQQQLDAAVLADVRLGQGPYLSGAVEATVSPADGPAPGSI